MARAPRRTRRPPRRSVFAIAPLVVVAMLLADAGPTAAIRAGGEVAGNFGSPTRVGYDISYPQCGSPFPRDAAFGIVGVNRGVVYSHNPCLGVGRDASQLRWAGRYAGFYANTANPGPSRSAYWPIGQTSPRVCRAANPDSTACAYNYGWNAAADSYAAAVRAYVSLGWAESGARRTPVANEWWLDVETANSWRSDTYLNVTVLRGAVAYLESMGAASVGFYSAPRMWTAIVGDTAAFADYPSWVAGAVTLRGAQLRCRGDGFTGGGVALTQYLRNGFDANHRC